MLAFYGMWMLLTPMASSGGFVAVIALVATSTFTFTPPHGMFEVVNHPS